MILISERSLRDIRTFLRRTNLTEPNSLLDFKMVRENQVRIVQQVPVNRNNVLTHVKASLITHHRIQRYDFSMETLVWCKKMPKQVWAHPKRTTPVSSTLGALDLWLYNQLLQPQPRPEHSPKAKHQNR